MGTAAVLEGQGGRGDAPADDRPARGDDRAAGGFLAAAPAALAQAPETNPPPKWGAWLDLEGKAGTDRSFGEADLFVPLAQDATTLFFANAKFRLDDGESREGNLGLGVRRMLAEGWNLGGYGYLDRRRSDTLNYYSQLTVGAELLGRDVDFRVNSYWPVGDRTRDLGTTARGDPYAQLSGSTVQVVTPGNTTREERALGGFDAEVGWRVPVFDIEGPLDLRLYAGGYRFDDDVVDAVAGPRLRAELTSYQVPHLWDGARLTLGAEWQRDQPRGSQGFLSARLRIPLQGDAQRAHTRTLSAQERRMAAPVVRDVDIVTQARVAAVTPDTVETATATLGGDAVTILSSEDTAYGTDLTDELAGAGTNSTVVLVGTFNTTAITTLQDGQTVMGSATLTATAPSGKTAVLTTSSATIASVGSDDYVIDMADNSTLSGMTVTNAGAGAVNAAGVRVSGVTGVTIANNTISAFDAPNPTGVAIFGVGTGTVTLSGNTISAATTGGLSYALVVNSAPATVTVAGNTFAASGGTLNFAVSPADGTIDTAASTGNVIIAGACGAPGVTGQISFTDGSTCP